MHIKIGSRGSKLAMRQSKYVAEKLMKAYPDITCEIVVIKTKGDKIQDVALSKIGDKGIFVKEIEEQLLCGNIDMAVHSMKDMPSTLPLNFTCSKTLKREDTRDVLILKKAHSLKELKSGSVIGTGSTRRKVQLLSLRPDLIVKDIRGNVDTRLRKLVEEDYDGIIMAAAGMKRMKMEDRINEYFSFSEMVPACGQGALAIELKQDNKKLLKMLNALADEETHFCVEAERYYLKAMEGNCHIPIGAHCEKTIDGYVFDAIYGKDCEHICSYHATGTDSLKLAESAVQYVKKEMRKYYAG